MLQGQATPKQIREQRRIRAKTYRDLYLLPRYVVEEDGSKRKLEAGEFDPNSKLYPLTTPIKDLSDFGKSSTHRTDIALLLLHYYCIHEPFLTILHFAPLHRYRYWNVFYDNHVVWHYDACLCLHSITSCSLFWFY